LIIHAIVVDHPHAFSEPPTRHHPGASHSPRRDTETPRPQITYWRTTAGAEVDFVIGRQRKLLAIEVKASGAPTPRDAAHLVTFQSEYGSAVRGGLVLHGGEEIYWLREKILAVPWWRVM